MHSHMTCLIVSNIAHGSHFREFSLLNICLWANKVWPIRKLVKIIWSILLLLLVHALLSSLIYLNLLFVVSCQVFFIQNALILFIINGFRSNFWVLLLLFVHEGLLLGFRSIFSSYNFLWVGVHIMVIFFRYFVFKCLIFCYKGTLCLVFVFSSVWYICIRRGSEVVKNNTHYYKNFKNILFRTTLYLTASPSQT